MTDRSDTKKIQFKKGKHKSYSKHDGTTKHTQHAEERAETHRVVSANSRKRNLADLGVLGLREHDDKMNMNNTNAKH